MQNEDTLKVRGEFRVEIIKDGKVIETYFDPNVITVVGRTQLAHLLGADVASRSITKIGFGENTTAASSADTALSLSAFVKATGTVTYPTTTSVKFAFLLGTGDANGLNITEFGLICADNTLFARKVRSAIAKTSSISLSGTWEIFL